MTSEHPTIVHGSWSSCAIEASEEKYHGGEDCRRISQAAPAWQGPWEQGEEQGSCAKKEQGNCTNSRRGWVMSRQAGVLDCPCSSRLANK
eukprot:1707144-Amphidinium_carterae.2